MYTLLDENINKLLNENYTNNTFEKQNNAKYFINFHQKVAYFSEIEKKYVKTM